MNVPTDSSPRRVAGSLGSMTEIRNKIGCFRDLLDFSPCAGSDTLLEVTNLLADLWLIELGTHDVALSFQLLVLTLHDIFQRYPKIKPASEFQDTDIHKVTLL